MSVSPSYIQMANTGELARRAEAMARMLSKCVLCPRVCKVDRTRGELGDCKAGARLMISSAFPHFGEEPPLVGLRGSGTVFLTHCNLRCVFCQNYDISHLGRGEEASTHEMAEVLLALQSRGVENINFVTPTHYAPQIVEAVAIAVERGLQLPLVWNCGGYESIPVLRLLEGIVDIYMPDIKFFQESSAALYLNAPNYPHVARKAVEEMSRQVGPLQLNGRGVARRGLLIRHLVMPGHLEDTERILTFIATQISPDSYVNVMDQYHPAWNSFEYPEINRRTANAEWERAVSIAKELGLIRGL